MNKKKVLDVVERTTATFGQAFLAVALVSSTVNLNVLKAAALAGGFAAAKFVYVELNAYLKKPDPTQG